MANISGIVKSTRNIMRQDTGTGSDKLRILQLGWMLFLKIFSNKDKQVFGQIYETFLSELQSAGTLSEFYTPRAITELLAELTDPKAGEKVLGPACGRAVISLLRWNTLKQQPSPLPSVKSCSTMWWDGNTNPCLIYWAIPT